MSKNILISGGTGLVGTRLTELLLLKGYNVSYLSRSLKEIPNVKVYQWDIEKGMIDQAAIQQADYIIHLAGSGIADEKWTEERKKDIIDSRVNSAKLLIDNIKKEKTSIKAFISASGIGIYGGDSGPGLLDENSFPGNDFLAETCKVWEQSVEEISAIGIRLVIIRIGIVLSAKGGALPKLIEPIRLGAGAALGTGKQMMSWIHIDDLCEMFIHAIENANMSGAYNAVAPTAVSNENFTRVAAKVLRRWKLPFNVPSKAIELIFGEMTSAILSNNNISNAKIAAAGFNYKFPELKGALEDLLQNREGN